MPKLTDEQLDWLVERIPKHVPGPQGGRPPADPRKVLRGIFWKLDNGAKWKDLPEKYGSKSTVHRWFQTWIRDGVFEQIMREAGTLVEQHDGYRLFECFIDGTFSKARGGGDGIGCKRPEKALKSWFWWMRAGFRSPSKRPPRVRMRASLYNNCSASC